MIFDVFGSSDARRGSFEGSEYSTRIIMGLVDEVGAFVSLKSPFLLIVWVGGRCRQDSYAQCSR